MILKNKETCGYQESTKTIQMSKEYTRTHGIEIAHQIVDHPIAKQAIQQQGHLDLSVWDFAGQHEYYNNHHYFLQSRSIFLILYKLNEQRDSEKGLKGLSFWFKSLSCHLKQDPNEPKPSFSIVVIGTHLDHESVKKDKQERKEREEQVKKLAKESGISVRIEYKEVSCATMENMKDLEESIYRLAFLHG